MWPVHTWPIKPILILILICQEDVKPGLTFAFKCIFNHGCNFCHDFTQALPFMAKRKKHHPWHYSCAHSHHRVRRSLVKENRDRLWLQPSHQLHDDRSYPHWQPATETFMQVGLRKETEKRGTVAAVDEAAEKAGGCWGAVGLRLSARTTEARTTGRSRSRLPWCYVDKSASRRSYGCNSYVRLDKSKLSLSSIERSWTVNARAVAEWVTRMAFSATLPQAKHNASIQTHRALKRLLANKAHSCFALIPIFWFHFFTSSC